MERRRLGNKVARLKRGRELEGGGKRSVKEKLRGASKGREEGQGKGEREM